MKAAVLRDVGKLSIENVPMPKPDTEGAIVKIEACAICTTDVKIYHHGYKGFKPPLILGHELSGTIHVIGSGLTGWHEGERVAVGPNIACGICWFCSNGFPTACDNLITIGVHIYGGFAEFVHIPGNAIKAGCLNLIPERVSFEEATLTDPLSCAINASQLSGVKEGDTVVVIGAGPTGCLNVEVAKGLGAKVILVQRSSHRLEKARFTGADVYICASTEDVKTRIKEETQGRGADSVIVACNSPQAQGEALELVRKRGIVNFFGGLPKDSPFIKLDSNLVHYGEISVTGTHGGSSEHCQKALSLIADGKVKAKSYITGKFYLEDLLAGIGAAEKKEGLKTIIKPRGK